MLLIEPTWHEHDTTRRDIEYMMAIVDIDSDNIFNSCVAPLNMIANNDDEEEEEEDGNDNQDDDDDGNDEGEGDG